MTIRNPRRRLVARNLARGLAMMSAVMLALSTWTVLTAPGSPASAATSAGTLSIDPANGDSSTDFAFSFDATPACAGDTAQGGYNWSTYMIPASEDPGAMTLTPFGPNQIDGQYRTSMLANTDGDYVAMESTNIAASAGDPGLITGIPAFTFQYNLPGEIPAGDYLVGVACTKDGGSVVDTYWARLFTVSADAAGGPAQITWAQGTATTTTTSSTTSTTEASTTTTEGGSTTTTDGGSTTTTDGGSTTTTDGGVLSGGDVFSGGTPSAASPVTTMGQLPYTGSSPLPMVVWAVALLVFGRMAMLLGKRPKVIGDDAG